MSRYVLDWSYSDKQVELIDHKYNRKLILVRGNDGGIFAVCYGKKFKIDPDDIDHVFFEEPKFFKAGTIAFFDSDGDVLEYTVDGLRNNVALVFDVKRKEKNSFYAMFKLLQDNGFKCNAT